MPDQKQASLRRLLNAREIKSLLGEFEVLLHGYRLSLFGDDGRILAGCCTDAPNKLKTWLEKAQDGQIIAYEDDFILPLVFESQNKGALIAHHNNQDAAPASKLEVRRVLLCLAHTLSLLLTKAIETRDVVDETIDRYREINLLYHIGETIGTCLDPKKIPQLVLQEANRCIHIAAGIVLLAMEDVSKNTEKGNHLEVKASAGTADHIKVLQQVSQEVIDQVIETKQAAIVTNPFVTQPSQHTNDLFTSLLCVPLHVQDRSQGVILLGRLSEQQTFTAGEMKLLLALSGQASIALETVRLHLEEIKKQRLEEELTISRRIQLSLLPDACPTPTGWEFAAFYQAARQVGGDLYDFIQLPKQSDKLGLVIADVAGKGIPAALFMAFCRTVIRMEVMTEPTPACVLKRTNQMILQNSRSELYLTAFYAQLNLQNGELVFANGGHNPPVWFQAAKGECQELLSQSYLIGLFSDIFPEECQIKISPGDFLVFYTDGITEARKKNGEFFGEERLLSSIMENRKASAQDVLLTIVDATNEFIGDAQQSDDFTLFVIKRKKDRT